MTERQTNIMIGESSMEFYKKAKEIIDMDMDVMEFAGGASKDEIEYAMAELSVTFPASYQAFLADFGAGDMGGEFFLGITNFAEESAIEATKMERAVGLPNNFVIVHYWDDSLCCLDVSKMENGECPFVKLSENYEIDKILAESFGKYLYDYENECHEERY